MLTADQHLHLLTKFQCVVLPWTNDQVAWSLLFFIIYYYSLLFNCIRCLTPPPLPTAGLGEHRHRPGTTSQHGLCLSRPHQVGGCCVACADPPPLHQRTVVWPKEEQEVEVEITCFSVIDHYVAIGTNCGQYALLSFRSCAVVRWCVCVCDLTLRATSGWSCWTSPRGTESC
jgi:hypothetical protein